MYGTQLCNVIAKNIMVASLAVKTRKLLFWLPFVAVGELRSLPNLFVIPASIVNITFWLFVIPVV
jgi:hypothetical protein